MEHEVSIESAKSVYGAIDQNRYEVSLICIGHDGNWSLLTPDAEGGWPVKTSGTGVFLSRLDGCATLVSSQAPYQTVGVLDVIFPILHGPNGEDGTIQGLLQSNDVAYVGCGVLGSAIGMDKDLMKRLLVQADLPTAKAVVIRSSESQADWFDRCREALGLPLFIKPANTGSSVGISKVWDRLEFSQALNIAFQYDYKVVVEEFIEGREIECGVLGTADPRVSAIGEITTTHEFYSYEAKYHDEEATSLIIPANISEGVAERIQQVALEAFKVLECEVMARMDFFVGEKGEVWFNEVNTIPGFTRLSMYPLLWEHSGVTFRELVETLVSNSLERHQQNRALKRSR